jgi:hypothetical protein
MRSEYEEVVRMENVSHGKTGIREVKGGNVLLRGDHSQKNAKKWQRHAIGPYLVLGIFVLIMIGVVLLANNTAPILMNVLGRVGEEVTLHQPMDDDLTKIWVPEFDLAALNKVCGINVPASAFNTCKNKTARGAKGEGRAISPVLHILGERHSATNLITEIMNANFKLEYSKKLTVLDAPYSPEDFGINNHKHNMQTDEGYSPGISIISIRNPYDWVSSMRKCSCMECFNCGIIMAVAAMSGSLDQLIKGEWKEGQHERPHTFKGIFDMRQRKFCNHLHVAASRTDCVVLVRAEDLLLYHQQERLVWQVQHMTGWNYKTNKILIKKGYQGHGASQYEVGLAVVLGSSLMYKPLPSPFDRKIIEDVNLEMNTAFERALGYSVIDNSWTQKKKDKSFY